MRKGINLAEKNGEWKGNGVGYSALHAWVRRRLKKPQVCERCHIRKPYDLANRSGEYKRDLSDWEWLCRKCHMDGDGRKKNLRGGVFTGKTINCLICRKEIYVRRYRMKTNKYCSFSCATKGRWLGLSKGWKRYKSTWES